MHRTYTSAALALMLGAATVASAQTASRAPTFAGQLQQYQNLSSSAAGTYTFHPAPVLSTRPQDLVGRPSFGDTIAALQAASSNSGRFEPGPVLSARAADPIGSATFAERFARLQAASSNSGQFGFGAGSNVLAGEANSTLVVAKPVASLASRSTAHGN